MGCNSLLILGNRKWLIVKFLFRNDCVFINVYIYTFITFKMFTVIWSLTEHQLLFFQEDVNFKFIIKSTKKLS